MSPSRTLLTTASDGTGATEVDQWMENTLAFSTSTGKAMREAGSRVPRDAGPLHPYLTLALPSDHTINSLSTATNADHTMNTSDDTIGAGGGGWYGDPSAVEPNDFLGVSADFLSPPNSRAHGSKEFAHQNAKRTVDFGNAASVLDSTTRRASGDSSQRKSPTQEESSVLITTPAPYHMYQTFHAEDPSQSDQGQDEHSKKKAVERENSVEALQTRARSTTGIRGKVLKDLKSVLVSPNVIPCTPKTNTTGSSKRSRPLARRDKPTVTPPDQSMETPSRIASARDNTVLKSSCDTKSNVQPFPEVIHAMVTGAAVSNPDLINWVADGEAFSINDKAKNLGDVLKKYFRHNKYTSLQRQLNMYGWKKHTTGEYAGAFHHPNFHRDRGSAEELAKIQRNSPPCKKSPAQQPKKRFLTRARRASRKICDEDDDSSPVPGTGSKKKPSQPKTKGTSKKRKASSETGKRKQKAASTKKSTASLGKPSQAKKDTRKSPKRTKAYDATLSPTDEVLGSKTALVDTRKDVSSSRSIASNPDTIKLADASSPEERSVPMDVPLQSQIGLQPSLGRSANVVLASVTPASHKNRAKSRDVSIKSPENTRKHNGNLSSTWVDQEVGLSPSACWSPLIDNIKVPEPDLVDEKKHAEKKKHASTYCDLPVSATAACFATAPPLERTSSTSSRSLITVSERPVGKIRMSMFQGTMTLTSPLSTAGHMNEMKESESSLNSTHPRMEANTKMPPPLKAVVLETDEVLPPPVPLMRAASSLGSIPPPEPLMRTTSSTFFLPFVGMANALSAALGLGSQSDDCSQPGHHPTASTQYVGTIVAGESRLCLLDDDDCD